MDGIAEPERQRCAIYTRKSLDIGLDQEFNSLETQRSICSAYICSQRHKGWIELPKHYDDAGRSGATLNRPELRNLMMDVESGLVDTIVVYKLDRITRTLLDFVRLIDFFERHRVSFVSITQSFDTSDSMGRLILNVLLTFAQFEREIFADRVRDKMRLIRQSGRWPGGATPLGYSSKKHILQINPAEARKVRFIFERFAEFGTYAAVAAECRKLRMKGRPHRTRTCSKLQPHILCSATISSMLQNPVYIGVLRCGRELIPGQHPPIIEKDLWDRVQVLRKLHYARRVGQAPVHTLLCGILYDCYGRVMTLHRGRKRKDCIHEYYASHQNEWGRRQGQKPLWARGDWLEGLLCRTLQELLVDKQLLRSGLLKVGCFDERLDALTGRGPDSAASLDHLDRRDLRILIKSLFVRVELGRERVQAVLRWREVERYLDWDGIGPYRLDSLRRDRSTETYLIDIPLSSTRGPRKQCLPIAPKPAGTTEPSKPLVRLIDRARAAQALVETHRSEPLSELARQMRHSESNFVRLVRLNYLAPDIITAILDGSQPSALTREILFQTDLPLDWALQRRVLGFAPVNFAPSLIGRRGGERVGPWVHGPRTSP